MVDLDDHAARRDQRHLLGEMRDRDRMIDGLAAAPIDPQPPDEVVARTHQAAQQPLDIGWRDQDVDVARHPQAGGAVIAGPEREALEHGVG